MLGSPCSPCCGCRREFDRLAASSCSVTIGGDVPLQQNAYVAKAISLLNATIESPNLNFVGSGVAFSEQAMFDYTPGNESGVYPSTISTFSTLVCQAPLSYPRADQTFPRILLGDAYKAAADTILKSHSLALDARPSETFFASLSNSGRVTFVKLTDDYEIKVSFVITGANGCQVSSGGFSATTFVQQASTAFLQASLRRVEQSATLTQSLADTPLYIFGRLPGFNYRWCPGEKRKVTYAVNSPYFVTMPGIYGLPTDRAAWDSVPSDIQPYTASSGARWQRKPQLTSVLGLQQTQGNVYAYSSVESQNQSTVIQPTAAWVDPGQQAQPAITRYSTFTAGTPPTSFDFFSTPDNAWGGVPTLGSSRPQWPKLSANKALAFIGRASGITSVTATLS